VLRRFALWPWFVASLAAACGSSHARRDGGAGDASADWGPGSLDGALGPRADVVVGAIVGGDADILRDRPALAAGKYLLMAGDAFTFFRGGLALFRTDWDDAADPLHATVFGADDARPMGLGDAHPENFGTLRTRAGTFRVEPNDFDVADRVPYLWDVRRFGVAMCLAARLSNPDDVTAQATTAAAARDVVAAAARAYADAIQSLAAGGARPVIEGSGGNPVLEDLFARAERDWESRAELDQLTEMKAGVRRLLRGAPDPAQPWDTTRALPARSRIGMAATVADYRGTLPAPPPVTELCALDAVQESGQGIGSFPRGRALVLTRGPTTERTDDVILEVKELPPQGSLPLPVPTTFASPEARLLAALEAGFTERGADPLWGVGSWPAAGFTVQIRTKAAGFKTVRVDHLIGPMGTPAAVEGLGAALVTLIARMHAAPVGGTSLAAIAAAIAADPDGFVEEQTGVALGYCDRVLTDWALFRQALSVLGPTLGVVGDPAGVSSAELRTLYDPQSDPKAAGIDPIVGPLAINEIGAVTTEFVELINAAGSAQPLAGYGVADADTDGGPRFERASRFAADATLAPGARIVIIGGFAAPAVGLQDACLPGVAHCYQAGWDISDSDGETMFLLSPANVIVDQAHYPDDTAGADQAWGRLPDGSGPFMLGAASPDRSNVGP
jgi:uncharacterized protein (DUF2252 family)